MTETMYAHNTRRPDDERKPTGWATYSGSAHASLITRLMDDRPMGPNYMGEWMWPVEVIYDPDSDTTRVGFSLMPPPDPGTSQPAPAESPRRGAAGASTPP